jgi:hypothetical protein
MQLLFEPETFEFEILESEVSRSSRDYLRWVQRSLNKILGLRLTEDGVNGMQTRAAVRRFQQSKGLQADGVVGPATERAMIAAGASQPSGGSAQPAPPVSSGLIKREDRPPAYTLYVDIRLGGEASAKPMTGIYVPEGYRTQSKVDLILYLHGFKGDFPKTSIDYYLKSRFPLREPVLESGKNVILVAPTLGPRSQTGSLVRPGGLDNYLGQVMKALATHGPYRAGEPSLGNLILACHSGGGWPMRQLAVGSARAAANIRECWGFDCLYNQGDETAWASWVRSGSNRRLFVYYLGSTETHSKALKVMGVPNVTAERSSASGHNAVPMRHMRQRVEQAVFLVNR